MSTYDLVIRNGLVVDGQGAAPQVADIAVRDGIIVEVGLVEGSATREVDADGAMVTPGFVDIHTHYDGQATWDGSLNPSSWHGVTTVLMGNCGVGFAPVKPHNHERLIALMEGVEDIPGTALSIGLTWQWESFPEYLNYLDQRSFDLDVATQLPHAALRVEVMGERGINREPANAADVAEMRRLATEAITAGALGFSTSRTINHRSSDGSLTPTITAGYEELLGIALGLRDAGRGVLQVVSDFDDVDAEFDLLHNVVAGSGRPMSISVAQNRQRPENWRRVLDRISMSRGEGLTMTGQVAPRGVGLLMGLHCTLHPFMTNRVWQQISGLPAAQQAAEMRRPEFKAAVLAESDSPEEMIKLGGRNIFRFEVMFEMNERPDYEPTAADSIAARAARAGVTAQELVYDLMSQGNGDALMYLPMLNYAEGNLNAVREMLTHPFTVPGLSDGGAHVGTICDVSFPTTYLTHWARDRAEGKIPVEYIVAQQTSATARTVGLNDRGVIAPGYRADLNVIDFENLKVHRPTPRYDLPGGACRLIQEAEGYLHTFVRGVEVAHNGQSTGHQPGRLIRGPQAAPAL
jgi:N-acyl-D-aspartate/D-glutamate deacylase